MARWSEVEAQAPELAAQVRAFLDAHVHKTLATLRRDGSPRLSGTVRLGEPADHLVIESWHEGRGMTRMTRT